jgi:hypothetical protein
VAKSRLVRVTDLIVKSILSLSLVLLSTQPLQAQAPTSTEQKSTGGAGPRKQLAIILYAGLGGSILGLSTLSFYGRPQDKLSNIAIGFAIGAILGTGYVTYQAATHPAEFYGFHPDLERLERDQQLAQWRARPTETPWDLQYKFSF